MNALHTRSKSNVPPSYLSAESHHGCHAEQTSRSTGLYAYEALLVVVAALMDA
jgi:hypothetical protein